MTREWFDPCDNDGLGLIELAEPDCFAELEGLPSCGDLVRQAQLANAYTD